MPQSFFQQTRQRRKKMIDFLFSLPGWSFPFLVWAIAIILVPVVQLIDYKRDCKKYGKEISDEIARHYL